MVISHAHALQPLWRRCQDRIEDTELCQECACVDARLDGRHESSLPAPSLTSARVEGTIGALFDALRREEVVVMTNQGASVR